MDKFLNRSTKHELLDEDNIPKELLYQNLKELDLINNLLGGNRISMLGIKKLVTNRNKTYIIVDIGCGSGNVLINIAKWARRMNYSVKLIGVDKNENSINYMRNHCKLYPEISASTSDYRLFLENKIEIDIIHCSLFTHHLSDMELIDFLKGLRKFSKIGFVINDLHRHWFAFYSINILTRLFNGSELVKNDAPLSVLKGFKKKELEMFISNGNIRNTTVEWKWAFRFLIIFKNKIS